MSGIRVSLLVGMVLDPMTRDVPLVYVIITAQSRMSYLMLLEAYHSMSSQEPYHLGHRTSRYFRPGRYRLSICLFFLGGLGGLDGLSDILTRIGQSMADRYWRHSGCCS